MAPETTLEPNDRAYLARHVSKGDLALFTGAGVSLSARNVLGRPIPSVGALSRALWEIAFPEDPFDASPSLPDIYDAAANRAGGQVKSLLSTALRVDPTSLPDVYRLWFAMPWYRHYTVNVDNLDDAAQI